jgi:hypothetical protein
LRNTKLVQDCCWQAVVPAIGGEPECVVGLNRIEAVILQRLSLQLCHQSNAAAFLMFVGNKTTTFGRDALQGEF